MEDVAVQRSKRRISRRRKILNIEVSVQHVEEVP